MPSQDFEETNLDILQNIEAAIVTVYHENEALIDANVDSALEALERTYIGEGRGRAAVIPSNPITRDVYDGVRAMCEWRLGRSALATETGQSSPTPKPVSLDIILACLKRIRKSLRLWTKEGGRQGYLHYVDQFL